MATDDEIISDFRRRTGKSLHRLGWLMLLILVYVVGCVTLYGYAIRIGWLVRYGIPEDCIYLIPLPVLFAVAFLSKRNPPRLEDLPERILRRQIDHYQRRWRTVLTALLVMLCVCAVVASLTVASSAVLVDKFVTAAVLLLFAACCALGTVFYPGLKVFDDERIEALRARSAKFGFVVLLAALGTSFPLALHHPTWAPHILIWTLFASGAAPALYYIVADWRASLKGDGRDG